MHKNSAKQNNNNGQLFIAQLVCSSESKKYCVICTPPKHDNAAS